MHDFVEVLPAPAFVEPEGLVSYSPLALITTVEISVNTLIFSNG